MSAVDQTEYIWYEGWKCIPHSRCVLQVGREEITEATCAFIDSMKQLDEQGRYRTVDGSARFRIADDPKKGTELGKMIGVKRGAETSFTKYKIAGRMTQGAILRLEFDSEVE